MTDEEVKAQAKEALDVAHTANRKIDSHEDICALRYTGIQKEMKNINHGLNTLSTRMWIAAGSVIAACIMVIIFLAGKIS